MSGRGSLLLVPLVLGSLALAASAAGTPAAGPRVKHVQGPIQALSLYGSRVAYGLGDPYANRGSEVLVWNLATGKTTKISGRRTHSWSFGLAKIALNARRAAWLIRTGANTYSTDVLFATSLTSPRERQVATVQRDRADCGSMGPHCAGNWIGGPVATRSGILVNRYTTTSRGSGKVDGVNHAVTGGAMYTLAGRSLLRIANGTGTVEAVSADATRVAVLRANGSVALYSSAGKLLISLTPRPRAAAVSLSGRNLVVLKYGGILALYDSRTGRLRKSFRVRGTPKLVQNLGVHGEIAIYTTGVGLGLADIHHSTLHAVSLASGKDRVVGSFGAGVRDTIGFARISTAGVAYSSDRYRGKGTLVFLPLERVAAAVAG